MKLVSLVALRAAKRPSGYVDEVLSLASRVDDTHVFLEDGVYAGLLEKYAAHGHPFPAGPGTELKRLLGRFGIRASAGCKCKDMALKMNMWGPDECLNHIEEIVDVMEEEAKKRSLPFLRGLGRLIVKKAIRRAGDIRQ